MGALNVEKVEDNALVCAEGAAKADVREQRVGNLTRGARHTHSDYFLCHPCFLLRFAIPLCQGWKYRHEVAEDSYVRAVRNSW